MNDKELLVAASKAYNLTYLQWVDETYPSMAGLLLPNMKIFNPLLSIEQAMWMSVTLQINLKHEDGFAVASAPWAGVNEIKVPHNGKPMIAALRALVMAAAAIFENGHTCQALAA